MALSPLSRVASVALVALLVALVALPARGWDQDSPSATLSVENGGPWGQWGQPEFCPGTAFASGFQLKVEPYQGFFGDDTALNAVRLICGTSGTATSSQGPAGSWSRSESCPPGERLIAFRLRVEPPRGLRDDSAANAVAAVCSGGSVLEGRGGPHGAWGNWSLPCPPGSGVCGLRTRVEPPRGAGDDTALNDVDLYCCV